jgi:hypothetical protein
MESLFSDYEELRATYHDDEHEDHKDALEECMEQVGDAYTALKDMMSGNMRNMDGGARRKHRKTRHRKTKKHSRRQTRRHH